MRKRVLILFLSFILAISCTISSAANELVDLEATIPDQTALENEYVLSAKALYDQALALYEEKTHCSSFYGNCGTFISYQLYVLGITDDLRGHNGNQWYDAYTPGETFGKFTALKYEGNQGIHTLFDSHESLSYVVISYPHQTGYTDENPGAGHAVFIYHTEDGLVYFTESYAMYGQEEGTVHLWELDRLLDTYQSWYGDPIGAVWFSDGTEQPSVSDQPPLHFSDDSAEQTKTILTPAIAPETKAIDFLSSYENSDQATALLTADGRKIHENIYLGTGMVLCLQEKDGTEKQLLLAVKGDMDGNGLANTADARQVLRMAVGLDGEGINDLDIAAGDLSGDGMLTSTDARLLLRSAVHLI